jgi:excisionase family DNA binding protein
MSSSPDKGPRPDPTASITDEFLTVAEIAAMLKLNQQTIRNWIDQGKLPALHVGRSVRVRRADFDAFLDKGYSGRRPPTKHGRTTPEPSIWDGEIPMPDLP